nr:anthocyanidin 5,3-O-glucosyltransferase-like [Aegilops tauschii subsp. strangulata]
MPGTSTPVITRLVSGIPSFPATHCFKSLMDHDDAAYRAFLRVSPNLCRSQGIIVNTFRLLEPRAVDAISAGLCTPPDLPTPPVYCIGPLIKAEEVGVKHDRECLAWLDTQPMASVVFLCFGSRSLFSANQTRELATGLEASGKRFLWVVQSPPRDIDDPAKKLDKLPEPDLDALLPEGFLERTKGMGLVVKSWAPQRDVLAHDAVGAFVTHCGWNSVLETVMSGMPMLAWPLYAEQRVNRVFLEKELGLAVAVEGYDKEVVQVASKVRWMMESDGGRVLREQTLAAMRPGKEALIPGGESVVTLTQLVESWMASPSQGGQDHEVASLDCAPLVSVQEEMPSAHPHFSTNSSSVTHVKQALAWQSCWCRNPVDDKDSDIILQHLYNLNFKVVEVTELSDRVGNPWMIKILPDLFDVLAYTDMDIIVPLTLFESDAKLIDNIHMMDGRGNSRSHVLVQQEREKLQVLAKGPGNHGSASQKTSSPRYPLLRNSDRSGFGFPDRRCLGFGSASATATVDVSEAASNTPTPATLLFQIYEALFSVCSKNKQKLAVNILARV